MVIFHKYEVRVSPGTSPSLTLYAPDRVSLEQNADYRQLVGDNRPCRLQLADTQIWYHNGEDNRNATEEEISDWITDNRYIFMPHMEIFSPMYYYPAYGDKSILAPLREKLQNDYADYLADWKNTYSENCNALLARIGEVCTVKTVYDNLLKCCDYYPQAYMRDLAEEEKPLRIMTFFYDRSGRFAIEPEVDGILEMMEDNCDDIGKYYAAEERTAHIDDHEQLMTILDENLDRENLVNEQRWQSLDFDEILNKAVEIHTMRQLYSTLRNEKVFYPAERLDIAARFAEPMQFDQDRLIGEREICCCTLEEINSILPQMYPDTVPEPNPWQNPCEPEPQEVQVENPLSHPFAVAEGKEQEYLHLKKQNSSNFYDAGIMQYLERWASMMEKEIAGGATVAEAAQRTRYEADKGLGITGFMYGCAVKTLSEFWKYGEELRAWHNLQYDYAGEGVVNPAILEMPDHEYEPEKTGDMEQSGMIM